MRCLVLCLPHSDLLVLHAVKEEEESRASISLLLVVAVSETSVHVEVFTSEDLDFIELFKDVLAHGGSTLLELRDSVFLAVGLEVSLDLLHVT